MKGRKLADVPAEEVGRFFKKAIPWCREYCHRLSMTHFTLNFDAARYVFFIYAQRIDSTFNVEEYEEETSTQDETSTQEETVRPTVHPKPRSITFDTWDARKRPWE